MKHPTNACVRSQSLSSERDTSAALVTVVIPAYNVQSLIEATLDSISRQIYPAVEIIVVDDGSTDATARVVQDYGRGVILLQQPNSGGCSGPRNTGLRHASGEFVTFFDADDLMRPEKIASQVACFQSIPAIVASLTDYRNFTGQTPALQTHFQTCPLLLRELDRHGPASPVILPGAVAREILLEENFNISNSPMYRTNVLRGLGAFDEELKASEDYELIYRVAGAGPIGFLRDVGFDRRMHDSNMSNRTAHILKYKILSRAKLASAETDDVRRKKLLRSVGDYHLSLADYQTGSRDRECLAHLTQAWKLGAASFGQALRILTKWTLGLEH
ncbi:glycosyltransferase family 2 protein [Povalibacter sp.]|uniref:glycosyltransferase family 2 protein n=1 Tax=Povalibacter sp. TaxID=1962978 RepID=UPI002F40A04D